MWICAGFYFRSSCISCDMSTFRIVTQLIVCAALLSHRKTRNFMASRRVDAQNYLGIFTTSSCLCRAHTTPMLNRANTNDSRQKKNIPRLLSALFSIFIEAYDNLHCNGKWNEKRQAYRMFIVLFFSWIFAVFYNADATVTNVQFKCIHTTYQFYLSSFHAILFAIFTVFDFLSCFLLLGIFLVRE